MVTKHGMARTRIYRNWIGMRARCSDPNHPKFYMYGGKGVSVCERWQLFANFFADMGHPPSPLHSLDRHPNKTGNYEPGNVRWATKKEQMENTERTIDITYQGETHCLKEWSRILGISHKTLRNRLVRGWSVDEAFKTRVWGRYKRLPQ